MKRYSNGNYNVARGFVQILVAFLVALVIAGVYNAYGQNLPEGTDAVEFDLCVTTLQSMNPSEGDMRSIMVGETLAVPECAGGGTFYVAPNHSDMVRQYGGWGIVYFRQFNMPPDQPQEDLVPREWYNRVLQEQFEQTDSLQAVIRGLNTDLENEGLKAAMLWIFIILLFALLVYSSSLTSKANRVIERRNQQIDTMEQTIDTINEEAEEAAEIYARDTRGKARMISSLKSELDRVLDNPPPVVNGSPIDELKGEGIGDAYAESEIKNRFSEVLRRGESLVDGSIEHLFATNRSGTAMVIKHRHGRPHNYFRLNGVPALKAVARKGDGSRREIFLVLFGIEAFELERRNLEDVVFSTPRDSEEWNFKVLAHGPKVETTSSVSRNGTSTEETYPAGIDGSEVSG